MFVPSGQVVFGHLAPVKEAPDVFASLRFAFVRSAWLSSLPGLSVLQVRAGQVREEVEPCAWTPERSAPTGSRPSRRFLDLAVDLRPGRSPLAQWTLVVSVEVRVRHRDPWPVFGSSWTAGTSQFEGRRARQGRTGLSDCPSTTGPDRTAEIDGRPQLYDEVHDRGLVAHVVVDLIRRRARQDQIIGSRELKPQRPCCRRAARAAALPRSGSRSGSSPAPCS
jgi:hypothetical protein